MTVSIGSFVDVYDMRLPPARSLILRAALPLDETRYRWMDKSGTECDLSLYFLEQSFSMIAVFYAPSHFLLLSLSFLPLTPSRSLSLFFSLSLSLS